MEADKQQQQQSASGEEPQPEQQQHQAQQQQQQQEEPHRSSDPTQTGQQEQQQQQQQHAEDIQNAGLVETYSDYGIKYIQSNLDMGDLTNNFDLTNFDLSDVDVAAFENVANEVSISTSSLPLVTGNVSVPTTIVTTSEGEHAQIILHQQASTSSDATAITVQEITRIDDGKSHSQQGQQHQEQQHLTQQQQQANVPHKIIVHPSGSQSGKGAGSIKQARVITNFNKDKFKVHKSPAGQIIVGDSGHVTYGGSRLKPGQAVISYAKSVSTPQGSRGAATSTPKGTPTLVAGSSGSSPQVFVLPPGTTFCKAGTSTSTPLVSAQRAVGKTQANGSSASPKQQLVFATSLPGTSPSKPGTSTGQIFMLPAGFLQTKAGNTFLNSGNKQILQITQPGTPVIAPKTTSYIPIAPSTTFSGATQGAKLILATGSPSKTGITSVLGNLQLSTSMSSSSSPSVAIKTLTNGSLKTQAANASGYSSELQKRKPCNCTKSQCLKLYCDCFANGEFCSGCNCNNCFNNLSHEEDRQKAIRQCLERNPQAFHPKIGKAVRMQAGETTPDAVERRHTKGCNCKRSGCLKNYCECYEAKILCSNLCKCCGCKNYEESFERKTLMHMAAESSDLPRSSSHNSASASSNWFSNDFKPKLPIQPNQTSGTLPSSFINNDVIQATCQCLLARAEKAESDKASAQELEHILLEEYGKCLTAIIDSASNAKRRGVRT